MAGPARRVLPQGAASAVAAGAVNPHLDLSPVLLRRGSAAGWPADAPMRRESHVLPEAERRPDAEDLPAAHRTRCAGRGHGRPVRRFLPWRALGRYLSALARFAAITRFGPTRANVHRPVRPRRTMEPSGRFFVDRRYPGYTCDKLMIGLLDAHSWAGDRNALPTLYAATRAARPHMADHVLTAEEQQQRPHQDETYAWDEGPARRARRANFKQE